MLPACTVYLAPAQTRKKKLNEEILSGAILKAIRAGTNPYLLCGDVNINPEDSPAIKAAVDAGLLVDVGHAWAWETGGNKDDPKKVPENTYHQDGPMPGMRGKGATRIDVIPANPSAAAAITSFTPRWDLIEERHVPLQVDLHLHQLNDMEVQQETQGNVKCNIAAEETEVSTHEEDLHAKNEQGYNLEEEINSKNLNEAHKTWNKLAEFCTMRVQGKSRHVAYEDIEKSGHQGPPRGSQKDKGPGQLMKEETQRRFANGSSATSQTKSETSSTKPARAEKNKSRRRKQRPKKKG